MHLTFVLKHSPDLRRFGVNKVRKIFFFGIRSFCLPLSLLQKIKKITIVIKTYITLEQKEMLWTRELQELFKKKKKCYPGESTLNTFEIFRATLRLVNT